MKPKTIHHEILLFTGTGFSKREFCEKDHKACNETTASVLEQLQKACWSGMLFEILPEIIDSPFQKSENFIWDIRPGKNFIRICIGPLPGMPESETCIDPYFFLSTKNFN